MEKVEREIKVTRYVAYDGTEFETEQQCKNYEGFAFGVLIQQLEKCTLKHFRSPEGDHCYFLFPVTRNEVYLIELISKLAGNDTPLGCICERPTLMTVRLNCNIVEEVTVTNLENRILEISNGRFTVVSTIKEEVKKDKR